MVFEVFLTDSAVEDLESYRKSARRMIADAIALYLEEDANIKTRRRKPLRPNKIAQWELRIADYRVFYDFDEDDRVKVVAVGHKEHNDLFIRGKKVEL